MLKIGLLELGSYYICPQKNTMFRTSHVALVWSLSRGVTPPPLFHGLGFTGFTGYGWFMYCGHRLTGIHRCRKFSARCVDTWLCAHGTLWMSITLISTCRVGYPKVPSTTWENVPVVMSILVGAPVAVILICFFLWEVFFFLALIIKLC